MHSLAISPYAAVLGAVMLLVNACGPVGPENSAPTLAESAEGSETISSRRFSPQTVPCDDPEAMARALLDLTSSDLAAGTRTRLLDHASEDVQLKDGSGRIAVIVYSATAGGDDTVITTTEHFLVNQSCQVFRWSSAVNPAD